ncbi:MAG: type II secretion system protein [Acidimicrobiia bacterium]
MEQLKQRRANDEGFTLIELLIAIVVVGILATVVIVGIAGLNNNGKNAACKSSLDAAKAATAVYYSNNTAYPATLAAMTGATPPILELPQGTALNAGNLSYTTNGWTLTMTAGNPPTFACS